MLNKVVKKLLGFSFSSWITAIATLIITFVSTSIYNVYDLGKINFFISVVTIMCPIFSLGLDQGYLRFYTELSANDIKKTFNIMLFFIMACITTIFVITKPFWDVFAEFLVGANNELFIISLYVSIACLIILNFLSLPYRANGNVGLYTLVALCYSLCLKGAYFFSIPFEVSYNIAIYTYAVVIMMVTAIVIIMNRHFFSLNFISVDVKCLKEIISFSIALVPVTVISLLNNYLPQFILKSNNGFEAIGLYTVAVTLASCINVIQSGFNVFWAPFAYENYLKNSDALKRIHEYLVLGMTSLCILIVIIQDFVLAMFDDRYCCISLFLPFLILTPYTYTIGETTQIGINISKKTYIHIYIHLCSLVITMALSKALIPNMGISGAAIAAGTSSLVALFLKTYFGNKYYRSVEKYENLIFCVGTYYCIATINYYFHNDLFVKYLLISMIGILFIYKINVFLKIRSVLEKIRIYKN